MWNLNIPRIAHFYWGGNKLSYLRYLTLATFRYYNPLWKIILYRPKINYSDISWTTDEQKYKDNYIDYLNEIESLKIDIQEVDFDAIGFHNNASAVHKSDFLRWRLLYRVGGLWADMDIIFIKSMDDLYFNTPELSNINAVFCIGGYGHSIGFLMSSPHNDYFKTLHHASFGAYSQDEYQCLGSLLCNKMFPNIETTRKGNIVPHNLSMEVVYAYDVNHIKELFGLYNEKRFTNKTIGIHWYGGSAIAGRYLNSTNGGLFPNGESIINNYIKKFRNLVSPKMEKNNIRLSIVMAYYNRQSLLDKTLESLDKSAVKDYELIIVDDASAEPLVCDRAKIIRVEKKDKWYTCSAVAFNRGLREATGDVIIIQNPECYHVGDILTYVRENIQPNTYLSFSCYAINNEETTAFHNGQMPITQDYVFTGKTRNGWYNHTRYRPVAYHFCSAILRKDLDRIGGFDERYARGVAFDDDDFIRRIRYMGMNVKIVNEPHVIHQFHTHFEFDSHSAWRAPHSLNSAIYNQGYRADVCMDYSRNSNLLPDNSLAWDIIEHNYRKYYLNYDGDRTPVIPRNLHMIWLGGAVPDKYQRLINTWRNLHPSWDLKIWNDRDAEKFNLTNRIAYNKTDNMGIKSDILRYEILYRYGGIYADVDFECIKPLDDLLYLDFFGGGRGVTRPLLAEGLMGCNHGNSFMKNIITAINTKQNNLNNNLTELLKELAWEFITKLYLEYIKTTTDKTVLFPDAFFYPMPNSFREEIREDNEANRSRIYSYIQPDTYAIHLWYTSWLPKTSSQSTYPIPLNIPTKGHRITYADGRTKIIRPKLTRAQRLAKNAKKRKRR